MQQRHRAIALFSGGLDSILAVKAIQAQNIDVLAVNFTSPFFGCAPNEGGVPTAAVYAERYNIPFRQIPLGTEFLDMIRHPRHGYGSAMNPCIDCKTFMVRCAAQVMESEGADCIITGEVVGQRPMSQRLDTLRLIEKDSGLGGLLVRPLSARFLPATTPEREGWLDRMALPAIRGRGRKEQIRLAQAWGVDQYPAPGGGCLLTEESFIPKVKDLLEHQQVPVVRDFDLLRVGRHFRVSECCKVIIGKNLADNERLLAAATPSDTTMRWLGGASPMGLVIGEADEADLRLAGRLVMRYTKAERGQTVRLSAYCGETRYELQVVHDIEEQELEQQRV